MSRRSPGTGSSRRGLRLPGRLARRSTDVAQAISRHSHTLALSRQAPGADPPQPTIAEARRQADAALVAVDDALLASAEELAVLDDPERPSAGRTSQALAPFRDALQSAQADVDAACELRAQAQTEPDVSVEADILAAVEALTWSAGTRLDEQSRAFDAARDLNRAIASMLPALNVQVQILRERITDSSRVRADLAARFPPLTLNTCDDEIDDAQRRIDFATDCLEVAGQLLRTGDRRGAIARARASEAAMQQATVLLDDLAHVPGELSEALTAVETLTAQLRGDLAQAQTVRALAPTSPALRFATATLDWATSSAASTRFDPLGARRALMDSDAALVRALGSAFDPTAAQRRAAALADCAGDAATTSLAAASTALSIHRAVVGADARLRLAEARRTLQDAAAGDPAQRLLALQRSDRLADQALVLVHRDAAQAHDRLIAAGTGDQLEAAVVGGILVRHLGPSGATEPRGQGAAGSVSRPGPIGPVSFGGLGTRARRGGAGGF